MECGSCGRYTGSPSARYLGTQCRLNGWVAPQDAINRQLVERSDILVGVFWTRIGTATGAAASGTVEEIERFVADGKPTALLFSNRPIEPGTVDPDQLKALRDFKSEMRNQSLYFEYGELSELRTRVSSFLTAAIREQEDVVVETSLPDTAQGQLRASVVAQVNSEQRITSNMPIRDWYITVLNNGPGGAKNVTIELEPTNTAEQPWQILDPDPVDHLAPNSSFRFYLMVTMGTSRRCNATIRWVNEDDSERISRQTLTL